MAGRKHVTWYRHKHTHTDPDWGYCQLLKGPEGTNKPKELNLSAGPLANVRKIMVENNYEFSHLDADGVTEIWKPKNNV